MFEFVPSVERGTANFVDSGDSASDRPSETVRRVVCLALLCCCERLVRCCANPTDHGRWVVGTIRKFAFETRERVFDHWVRCLEVIDCGCHGLLRARDVRRVPGQQRRQTAKILRLKQRTA